MATPPSSAGERPQPHRDDLAPSVREGYAHVLCTRCRRYRMAAPLDSLPAPGLCLQCRTRDPKSYWTRDWEKDDD